MTSLKDDELEFKSLDVLIAENEEKMDKEYNTRPPLSHNCNPEYDWEIKLKDEAAFEIIKREARSKGNENEDLASFVFNTFDNQAKIDDIDNYHATRKWSIILKPKVGSGFSARERSVISKHLDTELKEKLNHIREPYGFAEQEQIIIKQDESLLYSYLDIHTQLSELEKIQKPKRSNATKMTEAGHAPTKFGSSCFMCRYSIKIKSNTEIECSKTGDRKWKKSQCGHFELKTIEESKNDLVRFERKYLDRKVSISPGQREPFYPKRIKPNSKQDVFLGRICFTCEYSENDTNKGWMGCQRRKKPETEKSEHKVWEFAVCEQYKFTEDHKRVNRWKNKMEKSGADISKASWKRAQ